jgi:hypothetical protein
MIGRSAGSSSSAIRATGRAKCSPADPLRAGREHGTHIGGGRYAHHSADVGEVARILEQHERPPDVGGGRGGRWAARDAKDSRRYRPAAGLEICARGHLLEQGCEFVGDIRCQFARQLQRRLAVGGDRELDRRAEAERVLERVEPLEPHEIRVAARCRQPVSGGSGHVR